MKVCLLGTGNNIHTQRWVRGLAAQGCEVFLLCDEPANTLGQLPAVIINPNLSFLSRIIAYKVIPKPYGNNFMKALSYRYEIQKIKPDIVHGHEILGYGFATVNCGNFPKVLSPWGHDILVYPKRSRIANFLVSYSLKNSTIIAIGYPSLKEHLVKNFRIEAEKIKEIFWGLDTSLFKIGYSDEVQSLRQKLKIPENAFVVISNRKMHEDWGVGTIVDSIPFVLEKNKKDIYFIFLNCSKDKEFLETQKKKVKEWRVEQYVRFIEEYSTDEEIAYFLNLGDIFISVPFSDMVSISVLEGFACGAAPILTDIEVTQELLSQGAQAVLVPIKNPQAIAEKVIWYYNNREATEGILKDNRAFIEKFYNWDTNIKKLIDLYEQVISVNSEQ